MAVGAVAPDEYGPVILNLFGVASDYFIDRATADRVQRTIKSLQLMRELGYRTVPRIHAYYGDGRPCKWLQPGDPGFDNALRNVHDLEMAKDSAGGSEPSEARALPTRESGVADSATAKGTSHLPGAGVVQRLVRWISGAR